LNTEEDSKQCKGGDRFYDNIEKIESKIKDGSADKDFITPASVHLEHDLVGEDHSQHNAIYDDSFISEYESLKGGNKIRKGYGDDADEIYTERDFEFAEQDRELIIVWEAPNTAIRQQPVWIKIIVFFILLGIMIVSITSGDWTTFFVVLAVGILFFLIGRIEAGIIENKIYTTGVEVNGKFYEFGEFSAFSIEYSKNFKELSLYLKKGFNRVISVQIGAADPNVLRAVLREELMEIESRITFFDKIMKFLNI
jgi:hypothetical protein